MKVMKPITEMTHQEFVSELIALTGYRTANQFLAMSAPNIKEARTCQTCQGAGMDAYGYTCRDCNGYGSTVVNVAPEEPPTAEPEEYVRKVIVPQVDQYDFIAKRMRELEAERTEALNTPEEPAALTPQQYTSEAGEDFYMWGY